MQKYYAIIGPSVVTLVVVIGMIKHGYTEKLYAASALFLRLVLAVIIAMTFYKPITVLITERLHMGDFWVMRLAFLVLLVGSYVLLTELYERWTEPGHVILPAIVDRVGGMIFGALAGVVLAGMLLLTWSFIPYAQQIAPVPQNLPVDMGKVLINEYANLSNRMPSPVKFGRDAEKKAYWAMHEEALPVPATGAAGPEKAEKTGAAKPSSEKPRDKREAMREAERQNAAPSRSRGSQP